MVDHGTGPASRALFERALRVIPGGVHSPVRSWRDVSGTPLFIESSRGAMISDVDGRDYVDFCMSFGPLIFGHGDPDVRRACVAAIDRGWSFGAAEATSLELAELIVSAIPWVDAIRFVNSGTEAVMSAIRLARAVTGRSRVVKFDGCYHGHTDAMLIRAGSGLAGQREASSAGVPDGVTTDTLVAHLDDEETLEQLFTKHPDDIAAVIVEPLPANYGLLPQREQFLQFISELCRTYRALLIFDEVITGFRLGFAGYAGATGIYPDIVTWGKIIGGGFPVGAFAARHEIMEHVAPAGSMYQAGTLSANPLAMTAGLVTLRKLQNETVYAALEELGAYLRDQFDGIDGLAVQQQGSLFWLLPGGMSQVIRRPDRIPAIARERYTELFHDALARGAYLPPSPHECGFLSTAHTRENVNLLRDSLLSDL